MKRLKILVGVVISLVMLVTLVLGCAGGGAKPPAGGTQPITRVDIAIGRPTHPFFPMTVGVAQFVNKDSTWLRATSLATAGVGDNPRLLVADQNRRKNTLFIYTPILDEDPPLKPDLQAGKVAPKYIIPNSILHFLFVTLDPKIKTINDFAGKVIGVPREAAVHWNFFKELFTQAGLIDKIKFVHGGAETHAPAMADGQMAAGQIEYDYIYPNTYTLGASIEQLQARGKVYFVGYPVDLIEKTFKKFNLPNLYTRIPANSLPNQTEEITCFAWPYEYTADEQMDENIVYEFTKIVYSHGGEYGRFHAKGAGMTKDFMVRSPAQTDAERETYYHKGALKFFKEQKIQLKTFAD